MELDIEALAFSRAYVLCGLYTMTCFVWMTLYPKV